MSTRHRRPSVSFLTVAALLILPLLILGSCTAQGAWDALYALSENDGEGTASEQESESEEQPDPDPEPDPDTGPLTITVDASGGADYTTIQEALDAASAGDTVVVAAGSYGGEGAAGDPIVIDVADVTVQGAYAEVAASDASRVGHGVVDESGTRTGAAFIVESSPETEINDPVRITADGVTIDGVTFDVTAIFGFSGDTELSGGDRALDFGSGSRVVNNRFIESVGSDTGAFNQGEIATSAPSVDGLLIADNVFFGEAPAVQIGSADFTGRVDVVRNVIVDGALNLTVGPGSSADITISGNSIIGDSPFGLNGSSFAADSVPPVVLDKLNDIARENEFFGGSFTLAGSQGDDDFTRFASPLRDSFYGDEGNDTVVGLGGDDELGGGDGDDTLSGGPGNDTLRGDGVFANQSDAFPGDDTLVGGPGDDTLIGGFGTDTAVYANPETDYTVTLDDGGTPADPSDDTITVEHIAGADGVDTLTGVENFVWDAD